MSSGDQRTYRCKLFQKLYELGLKSVCDANEHNISQLVSAEVFPQFQLLLKTSEDYTVDYYQKGHHYLVHSDKTSCVDLEVYVKTAKGLTYWADRITVSIISLEFYENYVAVIENDTGNPIAIWNADRVNIKE